MQECKQSVEEKKINSDCSSSTVLTPELVPHCVLDLVLVHLRGQVVPGGQVLEAEQGVPVAGAAATGVVLDNLGGRKGGREGKGEKILLGMVLPQRLPRIYKKSKNKHRLFVGT